MISGGGLTSFAVGVGIPGFFMKLKGAFRSKEPDKLWDFTGGGGGGIGDESGESYAGAGAK